MIRVHSETAVKAQLLQIGLEVVAVYGDDESGWSLEPGIQSPRFPIYRTIDELFFALVNMNLGTEGHA